MALTPKAAALRSNATRIGANISKRLTRLASKDVQGGDILVARLKAELAEIRAMPVTNYHEARSKEARMRSLDEAAGTRDQTFQKAAKRAYRDSIVAEANDSFNISRMSRDRLAEVYDIQRSRLRGKVWRVKKGIGGNNVMTRKAEELLDRDPKGLNHNQLRSLVGKAANYLNAKTLTVQGAKKQLQQGVKLFGDVYNQMNDEQRGAVWEAMHRQMEQLGLSSGYAAEIINGVVNDQKYQAMFLTAPTGELQAVIGQGLNDTRAKYHEAQVKNRAARNILKSACEKKGIPIPDYLLEDEEKDQPFIF